MIHTGYWGCGVFGGNRVLMSLLQVLAAGMAGVSRLVFHTAGPDGDAPFEEALGVIRDQLGSEGAKTAEELVDRVVTFGFMWGMNDTR